MKSNKAGSEQSSSSAVQVITIDALPALATCSVSELEATFARARGAVVSANIAATRSVARTAATIAFVSILGR